MQRNIKLNVWASFLMLFLMAVGTSLSTYAEGVDNAGDVSEVQNQDARQYRSIYAELFGPSLVDLSFDSRFKRGCKWGYRVGIGYSEISDISGLDARYLVTFPLEVNAIFGRKYHFFEVGAGFAPTVARNYYRCHNFTYEGIRVCHDGIDHKMIKSVFVWRVPFELGYRYQRRSGFMLRAGVTPFLQGEKDWCGFWICPYISFGYTFK